MRSASGIDYTRLRARLALNYARNDDASGTFSARYPRRVMEGYLRSGLGAARSRPGVSAN
jgi:hypothetical protein